MVEGTRLNLFLDIAIATEHHIDVLPVPRLLLVQNFSDEKLQGMTEVCLTRAILLNWYILWIGGTAEDKASLYHKLCHLCRHGYFNC